jgi:hypothetical protein
MLGDIGVTASIFKYLSKYTAGDKSAKHFVKSALVVGSKIRKIVIFGLFLYAVRLSYLWDLEYIALLVVPLLLISANNRWGFAILKTTLFATGKTLLFWKIASLFSLAKFLMVCSLAVYQTDVVIIIGLTVCISLIETSFLKRQLTNDIRNLGCRSSPPSNIKFDYVLGLSSVLWVVLIQLDKIYFSLTMSKENFAEYSLFLQLCMGFFIISSTIYSVYGKDLYGSTQTQKYALLRSFRLLGSIAILTQIVLWNSWLYRGTFELLGINIFHKTVVISYLIFMFLQPIVALLVNRGSSLAIVIAYFSGIVTWLLVAYISISHAWIVHAILTGIILIFSLGSEKNSSYEIILRAVGLVILCSVTVFGISYISSLFQTSHTKNVSFLVFSIVPLFLYLRFFVNRKS